MSSRRYAGRPRPAELAPRLGLRPRVRRCHALHVELAEPLEHAMHRPGSVLVADQHHVRARSKDRELLRAVDGHNVRLTVEHAAGDLPAVVRDGGAALGDHSLRRRPTGGNGHPTSVRGGQRRAREAAVLSRPQGLPSGPRSATSPPPVSPFPRIREELGGRTERTSRTTLA